MMETFKADEIAFHARGYVPTNTNPRRTTYLNTSLRIRRRSQLNVTSRVVSVQGALDDGHIRYWFDESKWRALLAKEDQRDNVVIVLKELSNLDLDFRSCMKCVDEGDLSPRASFLVKMWRNETIGNMDAFLAYREPADRIKSYFHWTAYYMWLANSTTCFATS